MNKRLLAVKSYLELSLKNEKELEDLVYLASEICHTPIASITFIDDKKQYPVIGIGNVVESSCDIAFCNYAVQQVSTLEVPDAQNDPRFVNNPLVTGDPYIRFYAGVPLVTTEGSAIGTLCVIDQHPKKLTERQIKSLEILAKQVMHRLEVLSNIQLLNDGIIEAEQNKELLEQAEVMKTAFFDGTTDFFLLLNTRFEIVSFNMATETFFNNRNKRLQKGKTVFDCILPKNISFVEQTLQKAKKGEITNVEILAYANTEHEAWIKFTVSPTYNHNHELIGIACIGFNIDEDKKLQEKISLQNSTLNQIAQLHSHEIRHPLTNILAIIDILKQEDFNMTQQYLGYLESASKELDEVIKNVVIKSSKAA